MSASVPGGAGAPPGTAGQRQHTGLSHPARALAACAAHEQRCITQADPPAACPLRQRLTAQASITRAGRAALASARAARLRPHPPRAQGAAAAASKPHASGRDARACADAAGRHPPTPPRVSGHYAIGEQGAHPGPHSGVANQFAGVDQSAAGDAANPVAACTEALHSAGCIARLSKLDAQAWMRQSRCVRQSLEQLIAEWLQQHASARDAPAALRAPLPRGILERLGMGLAGLSGDPRVTVCPDLATLFADVAEARDVPVLFALLPDDEGRSLAGRSEDERSIRQQLPQFCARMQSRGANEPWVQAWLPGVEELRALVRVHDLRPWQQPAMLDCVMRLLALCAHVRPAGGLPACFEAPDGVFPGAQVFVPVKRLACWLPPALTHGSVKTNALDTRPEEVLQIGNEGGTVRLRMLARWELELAVQLLVVAEDAGRRLLGCVAQLCAQQDKAVRLMAQRQQQQQQQPPQDPLQPAFDLRGELAAGLGTFAAVAWATLGGCRYGGLRESHPQLVLRCIWNAWEQGLEAAVVAVQELVEQGLEEEPSRGKEEGAEPTFDTDTLVGSMLACGQEASARCPGLPAQLSASLAAELFQRRFLAAAEALQPALHGTVLNSPPAALESVLAWLRRQNSMALLGWRQSATQGGDGAESEAARPRCSPAELALRRCGAAAPPGWPAAGSSGSRWCSSGSGRPPGRVTRSLRCGASSPTMGATTSRRAGPLPRR